MMMRIIKFKRILLVFCNNTNFLPPTSYLSQTSYLTDLYYYLIKCRHTQSVCMK